MPNISEAYVDECVKYIQSLHYGQFLNTRLLRDLVAEYGEVEYQRGYEEAQRVLQEGSSKHDDTE